jgi:hypothetical protein
MRFLLLVATFLVASVLRAAEAPDPVLLNGLKAYEANGPDAATIIWFADRPALAAEMKDQLFRATQNLGQVIDTEVVAIQPVSKRVTRYYVAVYFTRCPLWMRVERYASHDKAFYLPLRFSINPDEILPGYLTEFQR